MQRCHGSQNIHWQGACACLVLGAQVGQRTAERRLALYRVCERRCVLPRGLHLCRLNRQPGTQFRGHAKVPASWPEHAHPGIDK
jgi:hypothetical protein